jgi:hypothetical protein
VGQWRKGSVLGAGKKEPTLSLARAGMLGQPVEIEHIIQRAETPSFFLFK